MGILDNIKNSMRAWLGVHDPDHDEFIERQQEIALKRDYRLGEQRRTLKVRYGQPDDNITTNFIRLIIDRSVSGMFGNGITFQLPEGYTEVKGKDGKKTSKASKDQLYLEKVWDLNKQEILLHKVALLGSESGTGYIKLQPYGLFDQDGKAYPRLIPLDPLYMTLETTPHDCDIVIRYIIRYNYTGADGKPVGFKEVTEKNDSEQWEVATFEDHGPGWVELTRVPWDYEWPPILHWQNLPLAGSPYGESDVPEDIITLQDRLNFINSNNTKIIRYHASPKTYGLNVTMPDVEDEGGARKKKKDNTWNPDQMIMFNSSDPNAKVQNLEMQSDLASSRAIYTDNRQALFDITRTVDIDSIADKLGALTNFGLKVLYQDALAKINTKRELYGDALIELNAHILEMNGMEPDGGVIQWPDVLPENGLEQSNELQADISMGILDPQSASEIKGYDWETVQERLKENDTKTMDLGTAILSQFQKGQVKQ
jgi:hypothetical protein